MIKLIIFDYDGVIVDSFQTMHKAYVRICDRLNKKCPSNFEDFRKMFGYNSQEFMKNMKFSQKEIEKANKFYLQEITKENPEFFHEIKKVLFSLSKKYKLVLVSANVKLEVLEKIKKLKATHLFDRIVGSDGNGPLRKVPELKRILKDFKLKPEEVLMIGDRINDYNDSLAAGINNVLLVEYGWGYDAKKIPYHKQDVLIKKPIDLLKAVKNFK